MVHRESVACVADAGSDDDDESKVAAILIWLALAAVVVAMAVETVVHMAESSRTIRVQVRLWCFVWIGHGTRPLSWLVGCHAYMVWSCR